MDTIAIKYSINQITNNNSNFIVEVIVLAYIGMSIYLMDSLGGRQIVISIIGSK